MKKYYEKSKIDELKKEINVEIINERFKFLGVINENPKILKYLSLYGIMKLDGEKLRELYIDLYLLENKRVLGCVYIPFNDSYRLLLFNHVIIDIYCEERRI